MMKYWKARIVRWNRRVTDVTVTNVSTESLKNVSIYAHAVAERRHESSHPHASKKQTLLLAYLESL
ncbi:MAG: hypothetical protein ACE5J2_01765 [Nitrososphaerales archaeon]